jgi:DNA (cytosine-5)-methyltransferase 1
MLRIVGECRPRWVVGENVSGLRSIDDGRVFGAIVADLAGIGYRVGWTSLRASDVGAPHRRERVFIVGHLADTAGARRGSARYAESGDTSGSGAWDHIARDDARRTAGPTQPGVCRATHGIPRRLVEHPRWPARPGNDQAPWEAPRTVTERIPERAAKLRALGNACIPAQCLPIFQAIADAERSLV